MAEKGLTRPGWGQHSLSSGGVFQMAAAELFRQGGCDAPQSSVLQDRAKRHPDSRKCGHGAAL